MAEIRVRKWRLGGKKFGLQYDGKGRLRVQFLLWERMGRSRVERRKVKAAKAKQRAAMKAAQAKLRDREKQAVARAVVVQKKALGQSTKPLTGTILPAAGQSASGQAKAAGLCGARTASGGNCMNKGDCPHHSQAGRRS